MEKVKKEIPLSAYPDEYANRDWDDDEWSESNLTCPRCQEYRMWRAGWYDGSPEDGGACIGTQYMCGNCHHYESH